MATEPVYANIGSKKGDIDVRLSYKIIELFSEGLYTSPNKAIEELVANSFDAGAHRVHVLLPKDRNDKDAAIVVIDDGVGMNADDLERHWLIGESNKREEGDDILNGRLQIGKFGIGKLATYVLAERLTHVSKSGGLYYSTSMNYELTNKSESKGVEPDEPIRIPLRELSEKEAQDAVRQWTDSKEFQAANIELFGESSPKSWTVSIMSSLKPKVNEINLGTLTWILQTALPLRDDFQIWLDGKKLSPSKAGREPIQRWVLGDDLVDLPFPAPDDVKKWTDDTPDGSNIGLEIPNLGHVFGHAEVYEDLLTGASDKTARSHGFFVYARGRLLNETDGYFGISPNELRHGTFGRFRLEIHIDELDGELRSNRESISEGTMLNVARSVLRAIYNLARNKLKEHADEQDPGVNLSRRIAESPASLTRKPIVALCRSVVEGRTKNNLHYLAVPECNTDGERGEYLTSLEERMENPEDFITDVQIDSTGDPHDGFVKFDSQSGILFLNGWHPFIAAFYEEFSNKKQVRPLVLFAMAEVLTEAQLYLQSVEVDCINEYLLRRDELLRSLVKESGRKSALSIANSLRDARTNPYELEKCICEAFRSLGFEVRHHGKSGDPDGVAYAHLSGADGKPRRYQVSIEAKSIRARTKTTVSAKDVNISAVVQHRDKFKCDYAVVVAPNFPTSDGTNSALSKSIAADKEKYDAKDMPGSITLITIDDLAKLVRLRPLKQISLMKIQELFENCRLPEESKEWVESIKQIVTEDPRYEEIVQTIWNLQKELFKKESVTYSALRVGLSHLDPPIEYDADPPLRDLCKGMAQMASGAIYAGPESVELDQSVENALSAIDNAIHSYPLDEQ